MIDNVFTYEKYKKLVKTNPSNFWYDETYRIFTKKHSIKEKDDVLKIIAFAYSWMPTIPEIRDPGNSVWHEIITMINRLRDEDEFLDREKLLRMVVPIINNSIVGTSKVLHFIAPHKAPIFDSRVIKNWNHLFSGKEVVLGNLKAKPEQQIQQYIRYWDYMNEWLDEINKEYESGITLRDLEKALFEYA